MIKTLSNIFKQDKEKYVIPRSVQQVIPIETIWSDGLFKIGRNKFARTNKFTDINYAVASKVDKETMFLEYMDLLNSFDCGGTTKITIKQSYVRTKENVMQSTEKSSDRENNPVGYAEDAASEYADCIFHETGHQVRRQAEKLIERKKEKASVSSAGEETVYQPKEQIRPVRLQAEKRHRSRGKNLLSKKSRPLSEIKEPSRPGEHRNR